MKTHKFVQAPAIRALACAGCFAAIAMTSIAAGQGIVLHPGHKTQSASASRAKFATTHLEPEQLQQLLEAHQTTEAIKLNGKKGTFYGIVAIVRESAGGKVLFIDFDKDYQKADVAVVFAEHFASLPDMKQLKGKKVLVSGKWTLYKGAPQIVITDLAQIKILL